MADVEGSEKTNFLSVPILEQRSSYVAWARILSREYGELLQKVENQHQDVIDFYGATNPAEFFAVITEAFFKNPEKLNKKHPELYEELKLYYKMDPLQWLPGNIGKGPQPLSLTN